MAELKYSLKAVYLCLLPYYGRERTCNVLIILCICVSCHLVVVHETATWECDWTDIPKYTRSVRKVSDRIFLCEHLMDYNLARLHEPTLNLSAHA